MPSTNVSGLSVIQTGSRPVLVRPHSSSCSQYPPATTTRVSKRRAPGYDDDDGAGDSISGINSEGGAGGTGGPGSRSSSTGTDGRR
jgi:hypothetical protein